MRRDCPTAWGLAQAEIRAGLRRWGETERGENYVRVLSHFGEGSAAPPKPHERTLGDLLMPTRPGQPMQIVNAVTRETGLDAMDWSVQRLMSMAGTLAAARRERPD